MTGILFDILVVLVAAKIAGEISERIGIPPVVGEIAAGVLVGRSVFGIVGDSQVLGVLAELGVILLLVQVGMEMDPVELRRVGKPALQVAVVGVVLPFIGGFAAATGLGVDREAAIFLGASLTATSVGITARVFGDLKALATVEARTVLGAAIADDVIGLVILTIVAGASAAAFSLGTVATVAALAIVVLVASFIVGARLAPWLIEQVQRLSRSTGTLVAVSFSFILLFSLIAQAAGLAPIVGAFVAGLALARSTEADRIKSELAPIGHLFVPVFFLQIGIDADVSRFADRDTLVLAAALLAVGVVGKLAAGWATGRLDADKALIGIGMLPRGEVGLIFAGLGLREAVLDQSMYGALLLVVFVTTVGTPPLLRWKVRRRHTQPSVSAITPGLRSQHPLVLSDGMVELESAMPPGRALDITLEAALAMADGHQPGPRLLDHIASLTAPSFRWDERSKEGFFMVLRHGNARSWMFLETSTLLDRVLPELAEVLRKRRADRHEMDPTRAFRWSLLERLHEIVRVDKRAAAEFHSLAKSDLLLLAVLALDAAPDRREAIKLGRRLSGRLGLGAAAEQEIALVCGSPDLLRAALARPDALDETVVLQIAAHVGRADVARSLYLTSLAGGDLQTWQRFRLDELHRLTQSSLLHENRATASSVIERRRAAALAACSEQSTTRWIIAATPAHLVAASTDELVRHAALMDKAHAMKRFEVEVESAPAGLWRVEVAAPDARGLLARTTAVLWSAGMNVESALAVTASGIALQSFQLSGPTPPQSLDLRDAFTRALRSPLSARAIPDAEVHFDDEGSPWATLCEVRATDREGLLHCVATAIATSDVSVRSARASTENGRVVDRFELIGKGGAKIPPDMRAGIVEKIHNGVALSKRSWWLRANRASTRSV